MKITLIRHAQGYHNVNESYHIKDANLTLEGIEQSKKARRYLVNPNFDIIYVSPLERTLETANIIFINEIHKLKALEIIRERIENLCDTRKNISEKKKNFENIDFSLIDSDQDQYKFESIKETSRRAQRFIDFAKKSNYNNICIVSHFGFIRELCGLFGKLVELDNCGIHILDIN